MTKEQLFQNIETLLPTLRLFQQTGNATLTAEHATLLRHTYQQILPGAQMDLACSTCILHYLNTLLAYYEREYPKYQALMEPKAISFYEEDMTFRDEPAPVEKPKRKRKKNSE